jgi:D-psicose/D-tagatose/L-ribulose 3-epimerase
MRFGICTSPEHLPVLTEVGYDYLEPALAPLLRPEQPENEVMPPLLERLSGASLLPEAWNVLLPGDLKVVGSAVDPDRQTRYVETGFARVAALGGKVVVFGSGGARGIPEGFSRETALRQIQEFLQRAGDAAERNGITVVIEPLNTGECNVINSVGEAVILARAVAHPAVAVLSDLYHVDKESQSFDETQQAGPLLKHVHVAGAAGRRAPNGDDAEHLTRYFRALKAGGYQGRISVEGQWENLAAQAAETLAVLRQAWDAA